MKLGEMIKAYREDNQITMDKFAADSGKSKGYISMLERNYNPRTKREIVPSIDTIKAAAKAMKMTVDELIEKLDPDQLVAIHVSEPSYSSIVNESTPPVGSNAVRIPVFSRVHAGIPMEAQSGIYDYEDIPIDWTRGGKEYFGVRVEGDCMSPKYIEGDVVIVLMSPDCESGQDAIVYVNGYDAELKRVHKEAEGITLQPLNSDYLPKKYHYNDPDHPVSICGVVVEIRRKV